MSPIEIQVCDASGTSDVVVSMGDDTTVADVFGALSLPADTKVDGLPITAPATTLAEDVLRTGASLGVTRAQPAPKVAPHGFVDVGVVAGLDAGASARLGSGLFHLVPHKPDAHQPDSPEPDSPEGWLVQIDERDPAIGVPKPWQQQGRQIEALASCGDAVLALGPPVDPEQAPLSTLHRPPRAPSGSPVVPIEVDDAPAEVREPSPLSWATLLAPIPVALLMAFFFRPLFALFAAMGPVMALGRWWESRRRYRRAIANRSRALDDLRTAMLTQLVDQAELEAQRRWLDDPHIAILWQRAANRSVRLWERRPGSDGFLRATIGVGPGRSLPVIADAKLADELSDLVDAPRELRSVPHTIDLDAETGLGVCGVRDHALAVTRSLLAQLVTLQGPADVRIGVLCSANAMPDWDWLKWLPHLDRSLVGTQAHDLVEGLTRGIPDDGADPVMCLVLVDDPAADVARLIRTSAQAGGEIRVIAVGADPTELPAVCTATAVMGAGSASLTTSNQVDAVSMSMTPTGISEATAASWARGLASVHDPEAQTSHNHRSGEVTLLQLVGRSALNDLGERWAARSAGAAAEVTVGSGPDGPFRLDLTRDGPHALVAGTTGSGKSELLRSLVVGLAVNCSPEHVNFVLVDFKGGGAFDVVRDLPHVVGVITDLDEALVVRALVSLRAELERRERLFRDLGVSAYEEAVAQSESPIARLVIVIDEFAVLATDYSELMSSIIDLAARGRSLGMHLVLATQRPSGVVDQKIRANTNLRIALRVQDAFDSQDVVGVPDAASIDRKMPGRALVCIGGDRAVEVQMAFTGAPDRQSQHCSVRPHRLFDTSVQVPPSERTAGLGSTEGVPAGGAGAHTELHVVVDAIVAAASSGDAPPRALWAPPLPDMLDWIDLGARELSASTTAPGVALGLADLPEQQSQQPWRWDPSTGALGVYAASGTCAGKVLVSLGAAMASATSPDQLHLYVIDGDAGATAALADLPHTGAYVRLGETDRVDRILRLFEEAIDNRRSVHTHDDPRLVVIVDNLAAVLDARDDMQVAVITDRLAALARDGAPLGVHVVVSARAPRDVSHRLAQQIPNRVVLALADPSGYLALGIKLREVVPLLPMRAIDVQSRHVVQLVEPPDMASWSTGDSDLARVAPPIRSFPSMFHSRDLGPATTSDDGTLHIPVGIDAADLAPASLALRPGEHALVVGAPGMGRSTTVAVIARQLTQQGVPIVRIAPHHSPLAAESDAAELLVDSSGIEALANPAEPTVIVIDDADSLSAEMVAAVEGLLDARNPLVHVVAATTLDAARSVRSWTTRIRSGGVGILIGGAPSDGEIFKVRLGTLDGRGSIPGRGHIIVRGRTLDVQLAAPSTAM